MSGEQNTKKYGWTRDGLRVRYRPRSSILHGLVGCAPWVDVVLIVIFLVVVAWHEVTPRGVKLELPQSVSLDGTERGQVVLVLLLTGEEKIVFDNEFFPVDDEDRMAVFRERLNAAAQNSPDRPLIIEADVNVRHGTIVELCAIAAEAGIGVVNLATKTPEGENDE
jgi:biopolymer transport protein ExbD